jgi:hypothetical protein
MEERSERRSAVFARSLLMSMERFPESRGVLAGVFIAEERDDSPTTAALAALRRLRLGALDISDKSKRGATAWRTRVKKQAKKANQDRRALLFANPPTTMRILALTGTALTPRYRSRHILRETAGGPSSYLVGTLSDSARLAPRTRQRWQRRNPDRSAHGDCDLCGRVGVGGGGPHNVGNCAEEQLEVTREEWRAACLNSIANSGSSARAWTLATDQGPWTDKTLVTALFGTAIARRGTEGDLADSLGDAFIDTFGALELELAESIDNLPPARRAQGRDEANNATADGDTGSADWMDTS